MLFQLISHPLSLLRAYHVLDTSLNAQIQHGIENPNPTLEFEGPVLYLHIRSLGRGYSEYMSSLPAFSPLREI